MGTIVVGVDGSESSHAAFAWALKEAKLRGDEILAVYAWSFNWTTPPSAIAFVPPPDMDLRGEAAAFLERTVKELTGGDESVKIRREVAQGAASFALIKASEAADMLVVGSRGLGGFRGMVLGSVGQQCAHYAKCPVVIIPHEERARRWVAGDRDAA